MSKIFEKAVTVATVLGLSVFASSARASVTLSIGIGSTTDSLGYDFPGDNNSGGQAVTAVDIVTELLTLSLGQTGVAGTGGISGTLSRSDNVFSPLPTPTTTGDDPIGSAQTSIMLTGNYTYLEAKYGNNEMVWDIAGIPSGTTIVIPSDGTGSDFGQQASGLSDETLLDPFTPKTTVPDGAMTLGLLGLALTGISLIRRKMN